MIPLFDVSDKKVVIYKITNPSERVNIGQSWNFSRRYIDYKRKNCKGQPLVYKSFCKYGFEHHKFEILQELPRDITQGILDQLEIFYIEQYRSCGYKMMNVREGGSRGKLSQETRNKLRQINLGKTYIRTQEYKDSVSKKLKGRKLTEQWKAKVKENSLRGSKNPSAKKIYQYNLQGMLIKEWSSLSEAVNGNRKLIPYIIDNAKNERVSRKPLNSLWRYYRKERITPYKSSKSKKKLDDSTI